MIFIDVFKRYSAISNKHNASLLCSIYLQLRNALKNAAGKLILLLEVT